MTKVTFVYLGYVNLEGLKDFGNSLGIEIKLASFGDTIKYSFMTDPDLSTPQKTKLISFFSDLGISSSNYAII